VNFGVVFFRIPGTVLACHPLVHAALSSLNCDPLSEASVNGILVGKANIYIGL
jgi:hypothetical protein